MSTSDEVIDHDKTTSSNKQNESAKYFMRIEPPKMINSTIIIRPPSKGGIEEDKKDSLSKRVKGVEESIKHGLHLDNKDKVQD
ncbi:MAG: hypothetical protein M3297_11405 [Thermoproteota archaeon]|nr:hypothetical protein [Thermoproteota archaeon]